MAPNRYVTGAEMSGADNEKLTIGWRAEFGWLGAVM